MIALKFGDPSCLKWQTQDKHPYSMLFGYISGQALGVIIKHIFWMKIIESIKLNSDKKRTYYIPPVNTPFNIIPPRMFLSELLEIQQNRLKMSR